MIASASDGDFGSGGVATDDVREEARDRPDLLVEVGDTPSASSGARGRGSRRAVRVASPQNVTAEPSGIGACIRTGGVTVR